MSQFFPACRHRREPRARWSAMCRSPKVTGLRMISPEDCRACPFVDHHFPGDKSGPDNAVHPNMPIEHLIERINGPARSWPPGWEDWDVTNRAHQLAANQFLNDLPSYPEGQFRGRGIIIAGGGPAYFPSLYVTVRAIRHVGCELPIEVWYLGRENELPSVHRAILERYGVQCVDADSVRTQHPCRILNGWELKVYAVLHSRFEEVLSLDADCYPVRDPSGLFDDIRYQETGAVFWPDIPTGPSPTWAAFGIQSPRRGTIETGQFLVHKRLSWRPLQLAWWYCDHSDWSFMHSYGDKGAIEVAWTACGQEHTRFSEQVRWSGHSYLHAGSDEHVLFVHRCRDKFRFADPTYMTPQLFASNRFDDALPLEAECFSWLSQLTGLLASRGKDQTEVHLRSVPLIRTFISTCPERRDVFDGTIDRWRATDWGEGPVVVTDTGTGPPSTSRHIETARRMLLTARNYPADYYLFLENDLLFNLHLRHNLTTWQPLRDRVLWMGSLYNPGLPLTPPPFSDGCWSSRSAWVNRASGEYYGAQAIVLSRLALETAVREWDTAPGNLDTRLATLSLRYSPAIVMHVPSLVQHLPVPSLWNGPPHRAIDFDPFYRASEFTKEAQTETPRTLASTSITRSGDPPVGVIIGSYKWPALVDLQCHLIRATCGPVPILVSSDHPPSNDEIATICANHLDVTFQPNAERIGHAGGDITAFYKGVVWSKERGLAVVAKLSQRFLVTRLRWLQDGAAELLTSGLPLASRRCRGVQNFELRTEACLLDVSQWHTPAVLGRISPRRYWHDMPNGLSAESAIYRVLQEALGGVCWPWGLYGEDRYSRDNSDVLWHYNTPVSEYRALAEQYGITLPADFHCDGWDAELQRGEYVFG